MRRMFVAAMTAALVLAGPVAAQADKPPVHGHFVTDSVTWGPNFLHRVFFQVAAGQGSKQCTVHLNGRSQQVDLGVSGTSARTNMFYLFVHGAEKAYDQAIATNYEPTPRVLCTH